MKPGRLLAAKPIEGLPVQATVGRLGVSHEGMSRGVSEKSDCCSKSLSTQFLEQQLVNVQSNGVSLLPMTQSIRTLAVLADRKTNVEGNDSFYTTVFVAAKN